MSIDFNTHDSASQPHTRQPRALDDHPDQQPPQENIPSLIALCLQQINHGELDALTCTPVANAMNKLGLWVAQRVAALQAQRLALETRLYSSEIAQGTTSEITEQRNRIRQDLFRINLEITEQQQEIHNIPLEMILALPEGILSRLNANFLNNLSRDQQRLLDTRFLNPESALGLSITFLERLRWLQTQALSAAFIQNIPSDTIEALLYRFRGALERDGDVLDYDNYVFGEPIARHRFFELPLPGLIFDLNPEHLTDVQAALFLPVPHTPPTFFVRLLRGHPARIAALGEEVLRALRRDIAHVLDGAFLDGLTAEQQAFLRHETRDVLIENRALLGTVVNTWTSNDLSALSPAQIQARGPLRLLLFFNEAQFSSLSAAFFSSETLWSSLREVLSFRELHEVARRMSAIQWAAVPEASLRVEYFQRHLMPFISPQAIPGLSTNALASLSTSVPTAISTSIWNAILRRWSLAHFRQLNVAQATVIVTARAGFFQSLQIRAIHEETFGHLSVAILIQMGRLQYRQPSFLSFLFFRRAQWRHVTPVTLRSIGALPQTTIDGWVARFSVTQLGWWTPEQIAAVFMRCRFGTLRLLLPQLNRVNGQIVLSPDATDEQAHRYIQMVAHLTGEDIRAMIDAGQRDGYPTLAHFTDEFFTRLSPNALAAVPLDILRRRTRGFTQSLNQAQRRALSANQIHVITADALAAIRPEDMPDLDLSRITAEQLRRLSTAHVQRFTAAQLRSIPVATFRALGREGAFEFYGRLSPEQEAALTEEQKAFFQDLVAGKSIDEAGGNPRRPPDNDGSGAGGPSGGGNAGSAGGSGTGGGQRKPLMERMLEKGLAYLFGHQPQNRGQKVALLTQFDIQEGGAALWNNIITPITLSRNSLPASPNGLPGLEIIDDDAEYALLVGQLRQDQMTSLSAQTLQNLERVASHIRPQQYFWLQEAQRQALVRNERYFHVTLETVWREIMPDQAALQALLGRAPERGLPLPMRVPLATYQAVLDRVDWSRVQTVLTPQKIAELGRDPSSWLLFLLPPKAFGEAGSHVWSSDQLAEIPDTVKAFWSADYWNALEPAELNGALARDINTIALAEMPKLKESFFEFPHDDAKEEAQYRARLQQFDSAHIQAIPLDRRTDKFYSRYLDANQFALLTAQQLKVIPVAVMQKLPSTLWLALREDQLREQFAKLDQAHATAFLSSWFSYLATLPSNTPARAQAVKLLNDLPDWQIALIDAAKLNTLSLTELDWRVLNQLSEAQVRARAPADIATLPPTLIASLGAFLSKLQGPQITALTLSQLAILGGEVIQAWDMEIAHLAPNHFQNRASSAHALFVEKVLFQASQNKQQLMLLKAHMALIDVALLPVAIWESACGQGGADFIEFFSIAQREALTTAHRSVISNGTYIELIQRLYTQLSDQDIQPYAGAIPAAILRQIVVSSAEEAVVEDDEQRRGILNGSFRVKVTMGASPTEAPTTTIITSTSQPSATPFPIDLSAWPIETQIPPPPGSAQGAIDGARSDL